MNPCGPAGMPEFRRGALPTYRGVADFRLVAPKWISGTAPCNRASRHSAASAAAAPAVYLFS